MDYKCLERPNFQEAPKSPEILIDSLCAITHGANALKVLDLEKRKHPEHRYDVENRQVEVMDGLHQPFEVIVNQDRELVKTLMQPLTEMQWEVTSVYYGLNCYERATDMAGVWAEHGEALSTMKRGGIGARSKMERKIKEGVIRMQPNVDVLLHQIDSGYSMHDLKLAWPPIKMPWEGK